MDAVEKIVAQIIEKGTKEAKDFEEKERQRIEQMTNSQKKEILLQEKKQIEKNETHSSKQFKQKQNRQQLDIRQKVLNKKQNYLDQLFKEAIDKMVSWRAEEFQQFAGEILSQLKVTGKAEVILGEYSKENITQEWLNQLQQGMDFCLSKQVIPHEGGFIVSKEGIEYNFLFSTLIQEIQKQESYTIAAELFN